MKRREFCFFIFLIGLLLIGKDYRVEAISKDLIDEYDNISIPWMIWSDGSTITVYDTDDYVLYGQWKEVSINQYQSIMDQSNICEAIVDEAQEYSNNNKPVRENFETDEKYSEAVNAYNQKIEEYNNELDLCSEKYYESIPSFDDSKWEVLKNDTVYLPSESFSGTKPFILYVKLEDKQNQIVDYDFAILELDGEEGNVEEDDTTRWKQFINNVKTNEDLKLVDNSDSTLEFIEETNQLTIKITQSSNIYEYVFTYENGIIKYKYNDDGPEGYEFLNYIVMNSIFQEIANMFDYDYDYFIEWLSLNIENISLEKNGIYILFDSYNYSEGNNGSQLEMSGDYIKELQLDIVNGITGYQENISDDIKNPSTGDYMMYIIGGSSIISLTFIVCSLVKLKKIKYN